MLVLTRKHQEQIRIGDNITLTILRIKGNAVRIGIEAPREVRVVRGELPPHRPATNLGPETPSLAGHAKPAEGLPSGELTAEPNRMMRLVMQVTSASASSASAV